MVYKCMRGLTPCYLAAECTPFISLVSRQHLWSAESGCLVVTGPRTTLVMFQIDWTVTLLILFDCMLYVRVIPRLNSTLVRRCWSPVESGALAGLWWGWWGTLQSLEPEYGTVYRLTYDYIRNHCRHSGRD